MRVGLISCNARPGDAIGNQVAEKLQFFRDQGAETRIFVQEGKPFHPEAAPFCTVTPKPTTAGAEWEYLCHCDLVIAEYGQYYRLLDWLPALAREKPKMLVDYHGVTPPELWGSHNAANLKEGVQRRGLLWCADGVIVHSRFTYDELTTDLKLPPKRLLRQPYPIHIPEEALQSKEQNWRSALGLQNATILLYVGRLAKNKNVPLLVDALHSLTQFKPDVHLMLVGDDQDMYAAEAELCRQRANELGITEHVHLLGAQFGERLYDAYRSADIFVTASEWESFCIPVAEAMAFGLPVIAARATVLPETVGDAGLTFPPGDAEALADRIRRVLPHRIETETEKVIRRIAIVDAHAGDTQVSGVTKSLAMMARTLNRTGKDVCYFAVGESRESSTSIRALLQDERVKICTFAADEPNGNERLRLERLFLENNGDVSPDFQSLYLENLPGSSQFVSALEQSIHDIDAIIVGPYLSPITLEIAKRWPEKTLLVPCFHDEPPVHLAAWRDYESVAGVLYHSSAEQTFAQATLGYNIPNAVVAGTLLNSSSNQKGIGTEKKGRRTLVYCGRYVSEKNFPLLLEFARSYAQSHPNRFTFQFIGAGNVSVPPQEAFEDLGKVSEQIKNEALAKADALINLSCNESLSLVALEAWQAGTAVIAHPHCAVLVEHINNSEGGVLVDDYYSFAQTLDDLWDNPGKWQDKGQNGRQYVQEQYGSELAFAARLAAVLDNMSTPLLEKMRRSGRDRAARFSRTAWRTAFTTFVEGVLHHDEPAREYRVEVRRRAARHTAHLSASRFLAPVVVHNWGLLPVIASGPAKTVLCSRVYEEFTGSPVTSIVRTPLPRMVNPGNNAPAAVAVAVPDCEGAYQVQFWAETANAATDAGNEDRMTSTMQLIVSNNARAKSTCCATLLDNVRLELNEAEQVQRLPDDYLDITQGALAKLKKKIKHKLLNNFKVAYVDELSHQQSAFNRQMLSAVEDLVRCCELLDHAVQQLHAKQRRKRKRKAAQKSSELS